MSKIPAKVEFFGDSRPLVFALPHGRSVSDVRSFSINGTVGCLVRFKPTATRAEVEGFDNLTPSQQRKIVEIKTGYKLDARWER